MLCAVYFELIMIGVKMKNGFIDFSKTDFRCPNCKKKYSDLDDEYLKRCEKNKDWTTRINCKCGNAFYMTYNCMGDAVSFI